MGAQIKRALYSALAKDHILAAQLDTLQEHQQTAVMNCYNEHIKSVK